MSTLTHYLPTTPTTQPPAKWREFLECRQCKRSIIEASDQLDLHIIIAGSYSVHQHPCCISGDNLLPTTAPQYLSTAEEADLRVWRHVKQTTATTILVYSDVYNIGLTALQENTEVVVR